MQHVINPKVHDAVRYVQHHPGCTLDDVAEKQNAGMYPRKSAFTAIDRAVSEGWIIKKDLPGESVYNSETRRFTEPHNLYAVSVTPEVRESIISIYAKEVTMPMRELSDHVKILVEDVDQVLIEAGESSHPLAARVQYRLDKVTNLPETGKNKFGEYCPVSRYNW
jgi:hypothetical protein